MNRHSQMHGLKSRTDFLLYDLTIFDDDDGDVVVDKCQHIQIQHINITFYCQNNFSAHFAAAGVFGDSNSAV